MSSSSAPPPPPLKSAAGLWLQRVEHAFAPLLPADGGLPLTAFLAASALVKEGYIVLYSEGMISRTLRDDLQGNLTKVEETAARHASATVRAYVEAELAAAGGDAGAAKSRDGLYAGLWLARTLLFVARLLELLGEPGAPEISVAGRQTYDEVLHPYHGPLMGWVVGAAFSWAPKRHALTDQLREHDGMDEAAATALLARAAAALSPVAKALHELYVARNINWPDKVGV